MNLPDTSKRELALAELAESNPRQRRSKASQGWREVSVHLVEPTSPEEELALQLADERLAQLAERALLAHYKIKEAFHATEE